MGKPLIPSAAATAPATPAPAASAPKADKPKLTKAEKQALFAVPGSIDGEIAALEAQIAECKDRQSAAIKAIEDSCGNGPFGYRGEIVRISSRTIKNEAGEAVKTVHFFKGQGKLEVDKID
jgi:hypothetical protein